MSGNAVDLGAFGLPKRGGRSRGPRWKRKPETQSVGDKTARLWNLDGELLQVFKGHTAHVYHASFSCDGSKVVTASADDTARIFATSSGECLQTLAGHASAVYKAVFSPDDAQVLTAAADTFAGLFDVQSGEFLKYFAEHRLAVHIADFSGDGSKVLTAGEPDAFHTQCSGPLQAYIAARRGARCMSTRPQPGHLAELAIAFLRRTCIHQRDRYPKIFQPGQEGPYEWMTQAFLLRHLWCPSFSGSWTYPLDPRCHNLTLIAATTYMANSDFWHLAPRPGRKAPRPDRLRAPRALYPLDPRCHNLTLIAATTYMANSDFWHLAPRPGRKAPRPDRLRAPRALCQGLLAAEGPIVAFVEMRYLPEFLDLLGGASTPPFVLVTCGSDAPLTQQLQERLLAVSGFRACYSSNLHVPSYELKETG
eukprot:g8696.t2